ncbi:MAG TPA: hypothetical protein VND65_07520 [Candidatus Binatia bacterium]|nr:hypothetical protein [Candidatus Binatia bacterium]
MNTVRLSLGFTAFLFLAVTFASGQSSASKPAATKLAGTTIQDKTRDTATSQSGNTDQSCTPQSKTPPVITSNVAEGAKDVSGTIQQLNTAASGTTCSAKVELWMLLVALGDKPSDDDLSKTTDGHGHQARTLLGSATASGNQFDIKLSDALVDGQTIFVKETISKTSGNATTDESTIFSDVIDVAGFGNWGLVRAYFTSGFLLSQDQGSFSQSHLFLAFTLDKTWKLPGVPGDKSIHRWPPGINSFFETRLTAIPVTACTAGSTSSGSGGTGGSTTSGSCDSSSTGSLTTFLADQKTARLDIGAYMPYTMTGFTYKGTPNALFLAPIAKIGFDTPAGSINQTQPSNTSGTTTTGTVTPVNPANFYKFYTFGGRFGHYAMGNSKDEAPETLSYLDFSFGRFSNLESLVQTAAFPTSRERLWRISVEGILKIPSTPLIIGVSANVGMNNPGAPKVVQNAGDDLRFLFGAKFDVAKLLARVVQVAP